MALRVGRSGEKIALEALVNKTAPQALRLKLYKNNYTPGEQDTAANYTVADFTGYSDADLTGATWNAATPGVEGSPPDPSYIDYPKQTFTSSAGSQNQPIYGYFIVQQTSGLLVWAERFPDGPYTIVNNGDKIEVTPKITAG